MRAERTSMMLQTVIAVEQGRYLPSPGVAFRIAQVFGVRPDERNSCIRDSPEVTR